MNRIERLTVVIAIMAVLIADFYKPLYASLPQKKLVIPIEWQERIVANQNSINEAMKKLKDAQKDSKNILDKILKHNRIEKVPGINYELRYEGNKWKLYQTQM